MIFRYLLHGIRTIEIYNNQLYIETTDSPITNATERSLPNGNYTASSLAAKLILFSQTRFPEIGFSCDYNNNVGTLNVTNSSDSQFRILADDTAVSLQGNDWYGDDGHHLCSPDINTLRSVNEAFREFSSVSFGNVFSKVVL